MVDENLDIENYIGSSILKIKSILVEKIEDPIKGKRSVQNRFILTSYPSRDSEYPIITIRKTGESQAQSSGQRSQALFQNLEIEIRVWTLNERQKDKLSSKVTNTLRKYQTNSTRGTIKFGLYDFKMLSSVPVDEDGAQGVKSNVMTFSYSLELL